MVIVETQLGTKPRKSEQSLKLPPDNPELYLFARPSLNLANTLPSAEVNPFEQKRRTYMLSFMQDYPEAWRAWEEGGLLDTTAGAQNIIEHSVVAAILGRLLAQQIGLSLMDQHDVAIALLVHDADRLIEKQKLLAAIAKPKNSNQRRTVEHMLVGGHTILQGIVQDHIIPLASANVPSDKKVPQDPRYQIVHYIDAILDGSLAKSPEERMRAGANSSGGRNPAVINLRYKIHESALGLEFAKDGYGYVQLQIDHANQEATLFTHAMGQDGMRRVNAGELPKYLGELFDEEVRQFVE